MNFKLARAAAASAPIPENKRMALKEWCQRLQPLQLYIMLTLTTVFFAVELAISHFTHSLTLLMDSYHMLCNIIALLGCLITIKKLNSEDASRPKSPPTPTDSEIVKTYKEKQTVDADDSEKSLKNTFGWARIDVLVMLIGCIFLASLSFSLLVEALQTLVHIDHQDEMHFPLVVLVLAGVGLLLNGFCYLLIGGYTFHHGSYFHVTPSGDVVLDRRVTPASLQQGQRRLSSQTRKVEEISNAQNAAPQRQGVREMLRDVIGCFYVIICGAVVFFTSGHNFTKYLDPVISIFSSISLLVLSYPYMKESGLILLQTIPNDINIVLLRKELLCEFPDIVNIHDLHVWQFTIDRVFATAHIVFLHPQNYLKINKELTEFFTLKGITQSTIQAEFLPPGLTQCPTQQPCMMPCLTLECRLRNCCVDEDQINGTVLENIEIGSGDGKCQVTAKNNDMIVTTYTTVL